MSVKNVILVFVIVLVTSVTAFGSDTVAETIFTERLEDNPRVNLAQIKPVQVSETNEFNNVFMSQDKLPSVPKRNAAIQSLISRDTSTEITRMLEQDHKDNVSDLIQYRWVFRKLANITEAFGNGLLYLGTGLNTIAAGVTMVGSQQTANIILFIGTACVAGHVTFLGLAKCSAREQGEREGQLESLANAVGFQITSLQPEIIDDDEDDDEKLVSVKKRKSRAKISVIEE